MKIKIDGSEIAAILKDWAQRQYKTHNIHVDLGTDKRGTYSEIEVTMGQDDFGSAKSNIVEAAFQQHLRNLPPEGLMGVAQEPDAVTHYTGFIGGETSTL